jgi:alcohol dehydrogenase (NADP+)
VFTVHARCICGPRESFRAIEIERRSAGPRDVVINIAYVGICHSDIEYASDKRRNTRFPLVPGHEIAGVVAAVGSGVTTFAVGDRVGVGCMVDSCRACDSCRAGLEQYCSGGRVLTYNAVGRDGRVTQGGYSEMIVVDEHFVVRIPDALSLQSAAPMFCAGITTYSPLRHWKAGPGARVAILGLGGLGHLGAQIARALGAHTTVFDLADAKRYDAFRLGADAFEVPSPETLHELAGSFDLIISTVPGNFDLDGYLGLLARDGVFVNTGAPDKPLSIAAASLLNNRRSIAGTRSGGLRETQEMIDFCAAHRIKAEVEVIDANEIDRAYARVVAGDVRFRFVIDVATMKPAGARSVRPA